MTLKPVERLEKTLARVAREEGLDQERLRRRVSFLALCGVLERSIEKGVAITQKAGWYGTPLRTSGAHH